MVSLSCAENVQTEEKEEAGDGEDGGGGGDGGAEEEAASDGARPAAIAEVALAEAHVEGLAAVGVEGLGAALLPVGRRPLEAEALGGDDVRPLLLVLQRLAAPAGGAGLHLHRGGAVGEAGRRHVELELVFA